MFTPYFSRKKSKMSLISTDHQLLLPKPQQLLILVSVDPSKGAAAGKKAAAMPPDNQPVVGQVQVSMDPS
jgi:hypothetical protein